MLFLLVMKFDLVKYLYLACINLLREVIKFTNLSSEEYVIFRLFPQYFVYICKCPLHKIRSINIY